MKVDVMGLAASIKDAIKGPRRDELRWMVDEMAKALVAAEAVVAKLPVTADGVPITPGMDLWERVPHTDTLHSIRHHRRITGFSVGKDGIEALAFANGASLTSDGGTYYSAREAAESAAAGGGEGRVG